MPGLVYPVYRLAVIGVGLGVALFLWLMFAKTRLGMQIRAGAVNRRMVAALGVNIRLLYTLVFGLGSLLAGLAGVMAGPILAVESGMGESILILTFVVIVIGGIGSVRGALAGALLVGMSDTLGRAFLPDIFRLFTSSAQADSAAGIPCLHVHLHSHGSHPGMEAPKAFSRPTHDETVQTLYRNHSGRHPVVSPFCPRWHRPLARPITSLFSAGS